MTILSIVHLMMMISQSVSHLSLRAIFFNRTPREEEEGESEMDEKGETSQRQSEKNANERTKE